MLSKNGYVVVAKEKTRENSIWWANVAHSGYNLPLIFHGVLASIVEILDSVFINLKLGTKFESSKPVPKKQWLTENKLAYWCEYCRLFIPHFQYCYFAQKFEHEPGCIEGNLQTNPYIALTYLPVDESMHTKGVGDRQCREAVS